MIYPSSNNLWAVPRTENLCSPLLEQWSLYCMTLNVMLSSPGTINRASWIIMWVGVSNLL